MGEQGLLEDGQSPGGTERQYRTPPDAVQTEQREEPSLEIV